MTLSEKINAEMKTAMKAGEKARLQTLRSIRALILEFEKSGIGREMTADDELSLLTSAAKKRKEAFEQFDKAGRNDLASKEKAELEVISEFLPKQLNEDEIFEVVKNIASKIGAESKKDFGKLMQNSMKELKGKADGGIVKSVVEKVLS